MQRKLLINFLLAKFLLKKTVKKTARARFWRDHLRSQFKAKMGEICRKE
jgi:hypothetical protein